MCRKFRMVRFSLCLVGLVSCRFLASFPASPYSNRGRIAGLSDCETRDVTRNDINQRFREKRHWEIQIVSPGVINYLSHPNSPFLTWVLASMYYEGLNRGRRDV